MKRALRLERYASYLSSRVKEKKTDSFLRLVRRASADKRKED